MGILFAILGWIISIASIALFISIPVLLFKIYRTLKQIEVNTSKDYN